MNCPECGKSIPEGYSVCPNCGLSLRSIRSINRSMAYKEAQARVRGGAPRPAQPQSGAVSRKINSRKKTQKNQGVPGTADYIRLVTGLVAFILLCSKWYIYSIVINGHQYENPTMYNIFSTKESGLFVVPIFFGILSIIAYLLMITNTFVNFRKIVPALKKVNTLRVTAMLYSVFYFLTLFFALLAAAFGKYYHITPGFVFAFLVMAIFAIMTFTPLLDGFFVKKGRKYS